VKKKVTFLHQTPPPPLNYQTDLVAQALEVGALEGREGSRN